MPTYVFSCLVHIFIKYCPYFSNMFGALGYTPRNPVKYLTLKGSITTTTIVKLYYSKFDKGHVYSYQWKLNFKHVKPAFRLLKQPWKQKTFLWQKIKSVFLTQKSLFCKKKSAHEDSDMNQMGDTIFIHKQRQKCGDVMKKVHFGSFLFPHLEWLILKRIKNLCFNCQN